MLISVGGRARHGKDTVANVLATELNLATYALAQPIKCMVNSLVAKSGEPLPEDKEKVIPRFGVSLRTMYQTIGDWGRSFDTEFWLKLGNYNNTIVTDVRFQNELEYLKQQNAVSVYVYRPNYDIVSKAHVSESWIATLEAMYSHDIVIFNNGSLADLEQEAVSLAQYISGRTLIGPRSIDLRILKALARTSDKNSTSLCTEDTIVMAQSGYSMRTYTVTK